MVQGVLLVVAPLVGAGRQEQVRHLALVHVADDGAVGRRAERVEQEGDLVLLHQPAHLLHRLGRAVAVVVGDEVDLAPGDAALLVHHAEIGLLRAADHAVGARPGRCRAWCCRCWISVAVTPGVSCARATRGRGERAAPALARSVRRFSMVLSSLWRMRRARSVLRALDDVAEALPGPAVPALQLHVADRAGSWSGWCSTFMPGSRVAISSGAMLVACCMTFSREKSLPHCRSTWIIVVPTP